MTGDDVSLPQRQQSFLEWRMAFERAHPEVRITPAIASRSGKWEVFVPGPNGGTAQYDHVARMKAALVERYGDDDG
jgi:hypothetical protein